MHKPQLAAAGVLAAAALLGAGVAAASHRSQTTQQAVFTFDAGSVARSHSSSCTSTDGVYQTTSATYGGTSTSTDPRLAGSITIQARSILNTTTQLGWLSGSLHVRNASGTSTSADIDAALTSGKAVGFLRGSTHHSDGRLMASFAASFTPGGGFSAGQVGTGGATNAGVIFSSGSCSQSKRVTTTAVFALRLSAGEIVPPAGGLHASASGNVTFDLTHDTSGAITGGNVVFYLNYRFPSSVTITQLALYQGSRGSNGPLVLDAGVGSITDADGGGNLTKVVTGASASLLQAVLANPHGYYVTLTTAANPNGALRDQLENPQKH